MGVSSSKPESPPSSSSKTLRSTTSTPVQTTGYASSSSFPKPPSYTISTSLPKTTAYGINYLKPSAYTTSTPIQQRHSSSYASASIPKKTAYETNYPKLPSYTISTTTQRPSSSFPSTYSTQVSSVKTHQTAWERPIVYTTQPQRRETPKISLRSTKDVYASKEEYELIMRRLIEAEEAQERKIAEDWIVESAYIQWTQKGHTLIGKLHLSEEDKKTGNISIETKLKIAFGSWDTEVFIDEIVDEELTISSREHPKGPPTFSGNFTVTQIFNDTVYIRMKDGLTRFLTPTSMSNEISSMILGQSSPYMRHQTPMIDTSRFYKYDLNPSQRKAAQEALGGSPIYLVLGPPGTGKTKTSVAIIAELSHYLQTQKSGEKILVCGPSNTAVDDLALKLHGAGVKNLTRMYSSSKENRGKMDPSLRDITLFNKIKEMSPEFAALHAKRQNEPLKPAEFKRYKALKNYLEQTILQESRIVCCTCSTAGDGRLSSISFRNVFIDEAAQSIEPDTLIPLTFGAQKVLLAGDHKQLGPVIKCDLVKAAGLDRVLFERLMTHKAKHTMLDCQYRMHPLIAEFPSQTFYEGKLETDDSVVQRHHKEAISSFKKNPLRFFDIKGAEEKSGTSWMNTEEAFKVEKILSDLISLGVKPDDIGIITPYVGQKAILQRKIHRNQALKEVKVASVDEFQGGEKGYIIMSTVRTNSVGFLSDERRLNVAITRARYGMILVGNAELLKRDKNWGKLVEFYQGNGSAHGGSGRITDGTEKQKNFPNPNHQNGKKGNHHQKKGNDETKNQRSKKKAQQKYVHHHQ